MTDAVLVFSTVTGIIIVGFVGEQLFRKTGVPVFVFLMLMGILIGPVLHVLPTTALLPALGVFAELTLIMVLFYGGMDTKIGAALKGGGRALVQVMIYVIASTFAIALVVSTMFGWELMQSFMFAAMIGGETTAAVVIPLSRSLKLPETTVAFLTLESAMNSIFSIVLFFAFLGIYETGVVVWTSALTSIASSFSVGIVLGAVLSLGWILLLHRFQEQKYTYVLTLGLVFLTYSLSARLGGSGELSVLIFGVILGNYSMVNYLSKRQVSMDVLQQRLGVFQSEISFLMRTLFFVFLGLTIEITPSQIFLSLLTGLLLVGILLAFRFGATVVSTAGSPLAEDRSSIIFMCAQGLTPATLAIIALDRGVPLAGSFLNIVAYVIILTNIVAAIGSVWRMKGQKYSFREFMDGLEGTRRIT